jgi:hypothetical protein
MLKVVNTPPAKGLSRPALPSGATVTLFANFLGPNAGCVLLNYAGTAIECEVLDWRQNSVTLQLPRWGLVEPKAAEIWIVLQDGRVAERIPIRFVSAPDIVIHDETVSAPTPPAPANSQAIYAAP